MIKQLIDYYWRLVFFRELPENSPYSKVLMVLSAILLGIVLSIQWYYSDFEANDDVLNIGIMAASLLMAYYLYTFAILYFRGLSARVLQTITCLYCTHLIIHLIALPLLVVASFLTQSDLKNPLLLFIAVLYLLVTMGLSVWQFVVTAHVYRYALNTTAIQSVLATFGLVAVTILTISFWR